jgi:hypothetical protein
MGDVVDMPPRLWTLNEMLGQLDPTGERKEKVMDDFKRTLAGVPVVIALDAFTDYFDYAVETIKDDDVESAKATLDLLAHIGQYFGDQLEEMK